MNKKKVTITQVENGYIVDSGFICYDIKTQRVFITLEKTLTWVEKYFKARAKFEEKEANEKQK